MQSSRDHIDQLIKLIEHAANQTRKSQGSISRAFFDDPDLKSKCRERLGSILEIFGSDPLTQTVFEDYYRIAINDFRANNATEIVPSLSLTKTEYKTWLTEERKQKVGWSNPDTNNNYRNRYLHYLRKIGRPESVIEETNRSSLDIVEKLGDPLSENSFYVKGLVVGSVQSGKTSNFNAVINSAVDAGYSLIIVLSGITEDLRRQTQIRIEKEVAGYSKEGAGFIGVGEIKKFGELGDKSIAQVMLPTSPQIDFRRSIREADFSLNNKNILICKKNTGVLKNLILWLSDYLKDSDKHNLPLLIIDDEADNASLNNMGHKGKEYATKINGHIRAILGLFHKKTYLGYTATPFANVLQDRNAAPEIPWEITERKNGVDVKKTFEQVPNIFPDDFIELLFPPSNYVGAKQLFETRIAEITKITPLIAPAIKDHELCFPSRVIDQNGTILPIRESDDKTRSSRKDDPFPDHLPNSLKEAILCFILSIAIRYSRKASMVDSKLFNPHHTMLIHISRFTRWQTKTKDLVSAYVEEIRIKLDHDLPSDSKSIYSEFEKVWNKYYEYAVHNIKSYLPDGYTDEFLAPKKFSTDIKQLLIDALRGVEILAINSETGDSLYYPDGTEKKYIAIGGNRLSRGFTLEGLTINYFIRNTDYADTLLQMGRWFGYRPGYIDCCKLFTTDDNIEKYNYTTIAIEELEYEFTEMKKKNRSPENFQLWVRHNPQVLKITREAFTRSAISISIDYSGAIQQSTRFNLDIQKIKQSWTDFQNLINSLAWEVSEGYFVHKTDAKGLFTFLDLQNSHIRDFDLLGVKEYINLCTQRGKLINWTIAIKRNLGANAGGKREAILTSLPNEYMEYSVRRGPKCTPKDNVVYTQFTQERIYRPSGKSANIVASGKDFSITLSAGEIKSAEDAFQEQKKNELRKNPQLSEKEIQDRVKGVGIPDKVYRSKMKETDGVLMIYLIDQENVFESDRLECTNELKAFAKHHNFDLETPLVGYALGFPNIAEDIGGDYIRANIGIAGPSEEIPEEEFDTALENED